MAKRVWPRVVVAAAVVVLFLGFILNIGTTPHVPPSPPLPAVDPDNADSSPIGTDGRDKGHDSAAPVAGPESPAGRW